MQPLAQLPRAAHFQWVYHLFGSRDSPTRTVQGHLEANARTTVEATVLRLKCSSSATAVPSRLHSTPHFGNRNADLAVQTRMTLVRRLKAFVSDCAFCFP